eukprot:6209315-Pleurochrysis_carterae.AAC.1
MLAVCCIVARAGVAQASAAAALQIRLSAEGLVLRWTDVLLAVLLPLPGSCCPCISTDFIALRTPSLLLAGWPRLLLSATVAVRRDVLRSNSPCIPCTGSALAHMRAVLAAVREMSRRGMLISKMRTSVRPCRDSTRCASFCRVSQSEFFYMLGLRLAGTISASLWQPTQPIFTIVLASLLGIERLTARRVAGLVLTCGGCAAM